MRGIASTQASGQWAPAASPPVSGPVDAIIATPSTIFAGTDSGVFASANGAGWRSAGLGGNQVAALAAAGETVLAGTGTDAGTDGLAYRSDDGGSTWVPAAALPAQEGLPGGKVQAIVGPEAGAPALAGTAGGGVLRSLDGGGPWTASSQGMRSSWVTALLRIGGEVMAGTDLSLYSSGDGGGSWTESGYPEADPWIQALAPAPSGQVLAGTYDGGVYRRGGSGTWTTLATGLPSVLSLLSLSGGGVLAGTVDGLYCVACQDGAGGLPETAPPSRGSRSGPPKVVAAPSLPPSNQRPGVVARLTPSPTGAGGGAARLTGGGPPGVVRILPLILIPAVLAAAVLAGAGYRMWRRLRPR